MSVCLSVVSHGSDELVANLLEKLNNAAELTRVIVAHNKAPAFVPDERSYAFQLHNIINERPLGYGKNKNNAFAVCREPFFCVANPDIDVDICVRTYLLGYWIDVSEHVFIKHVGQRISHRRPRCFYWHASSMLKFF